MSKTKYTFWNPKEGNWVNGTNGSGVIFVKPMVFEITLDDDMSPYVAFEEFEKKFGYDPMKAGLSYSFVEL